jgi:hypothetical protein
MSVDTVWVVTKAKKIDGEDAECWHCGAESPRKEIEIMGVVRMPAGTPFDLRKIRKHLIEKHGPEFEGVCFVRNHDINIPLEYLHDTSDTSPR